MNIPYKVGTIKAICRYSPEYFNRNCQATIPEYWEAEVELTEKILDYFEANNDYTYLRIYGTSQESAKDAVNDLVGELKRAKLTGNLKVKYI